MAVTAVLFAVSLVIAIFFGSVTIEVGAVIEVLAKIFSVQVLGYESESLGANETIIWQIRFPRVLLGAIVGAALAVVGVAQQAITRNPMADPYLFGISAGASIGAVLAILHTGPVFGAVTLPLFALIGGNIASVLVLAIIFRDRNVKPITMVLAGLAVYFVCSSATNLLIFLGDHKSSSAVIFWMLGGLGRANWDNILYPLAALVVIWPILQFHAMELNIFANGDDAALALGVNIRVKKVLLISLTSVLTSVVVAYAGAIGFVGLMVPHVCRRFVGGDHFRLLPFSALVGGLFLVWSDVLSRSILSPEDLPIGIITSGIGGLFFIAMLQSQRGR